MIEKNNFSILQGIQALTPLIIGIFITGSGVMFSRDYNARQIEINRADLLFKYNELLTSNDPRKREFAYATLATIDENIALKIMAIKPDPASLKVASSIEKTTTDQKLKSVATNVIAKIPKIYIHIPNESKRDLSKFLSAKLNSNGFSVQGIENVTLKNIVSPTNTEIRYFHELDKENAKEVLELVQDNGIRASIKQVELKAPLGQLEIWFAKE